MTAQPKNLIPRTNYSITRLGTASNGYQTSPGGLDLITPSLTLQPGALQGGLNFECSLSGGYARIVGYERVDGRPAPSAASFVIVQLVSFTNVPAVGDAITQAVSGATGVVALVNNGTLAYMVVTKIAGTFNAVNVITKAGPVTIGTATTTTAALTALLSAQYTSASADIYRTDIQAVPGSGSVLGVLAFTVGGIDSVFAFRNNLGGTAANLYKASGTGWTQVTLLNVVEFTAGGGGGTIGPADGAVLTQGAVTATIRRNMTRSGAWTGTAVGGFVVTNPAGGNFAAGAATASGGFNVTLSGIQTAITLQPGGRYEMVKGNFAGRASNNRVYGVDGANKAFEFDGTVLAPITTGLSPDTPSHVAVHKGFLFLSIGSSALYCAPGQPFRWSAVDGAGEIAVGDVVSGMVTLPGNQNTSTLAIYQLANTSFLYGQSSSTWQLTTYNTGVGARPYSLQNLFDTFIFDDFGVNTLQTSLNFGNFSSAALTRNILPFIVQERSSVVGSVINRTKGQYRVFFRDGFGLYVTVSNQTYLGSIPVQFPDVVNCTDNDKTGSGDEVSYFGATNGFVYQMDKGTSFDGQAIFAFITLAWDPFKSPRVLKRFRAASIEISGTGYAAIQFGYQFSYGNVLTGQPAAIATTTPFSPAPLWDSFTWDHFTWDGLTLFPTEVDLTGMAENVQVTLQSATNYIPTYQVNSVIYHYTDRRGMR